jgi:hypothetical protein
LWTTRLLARHAREHGPAEGHACLGKLAQGTVCKILNEAAVSTGLVAELGQDAVQRMMVEAFAKN